MKPVSIRSKYLPTYIFIICFIICTFLTSCSNKETATTIKMHKFQMEADSLILANKNNIDSLIVLLERFHKNDQYYAEIAVCRELGNSLRNSSNFSDALDYHKRGLDLARKYSDTIQIIQALNNMGTDYRRLGILDNASSYHYQALTYSDAYSDKTSYDAIKNKVISLNGIGNVQLSLGNSTVADSVFRVALQGEKALGSDLGQAINYANIGAIIEERGNLDSARYYYYKSLEHNQKAKSDLGLSLCYAHLGRVHEKEGNFTAALEQYQNGYKLMENNSDAWHWLESCISMARIYMIISDLNKSTEYLAKAKEKAILTNSIGHLAEVYNLEYQILKKQRRHSEALEAYSKSSEYSKQLANEKNITHMQNIRVKYEKDKMALQLNSLQSKHDHERRRIILGIYLTIVVLSLAVVIIAFLLYTIRLRAKNHQILREMEETRVNFFTNITHEFRTPLTIIISAANDVLKNARADIELKKDASDIIRNGKILLNLINQILEISKMDSKFTKKVTYRNGDIIEFITMTVSGCKHFGTQKNVTVKLTSDIEKLTTDFVPEYLIRILHNLISNAVKFSNRDSQVDIHICYSENNNAFKKYLKITVTDTGKGLNEQQKQNLFQPFYQAHNDSEFIGTGIGLSLVKLTVESLDGTIEVFSEENQGSSFVVTLPIISGGRNTLPLDTSEHYTENIIVYNNNDDAVNQDIIVSDSAPKILIVEDKADVAYWQMRQLSPKYNYFFANDGESGLKKAEELVPDLIITDVMMPGIDGYELCKRVHESELLSHIPVIIVTAKTTKEDRIKGLESGADSYVEKPYDGDILSTRVNMLLEQRAKLRQLFSETPFEYGKLPIVTDNSQNTPEADETLPVNTRKCLSKDHSFLEKLNNEINQQIENGVIDYTELGVKFSVARTQLNRKIKAITGMTTTEYIVMVRINKAKELLTNTDLSISEISFRCGIDDVSYFSSLFKKHTGTSPTSFRNQ